MRPQKPEEQTAEAEQDGEEGADLGARDETGGRVPMPEGENDGRGRGDDQHGKDEDGQQRQAQGGGVPERAAWVEVREAAFLAAGAEAIGTEVLLVQFHVAQAAEKPSADIAWDNGPFFRVIEANGLAFQQGP